jgi:hypothetical protein
VSPSRNYSFLKTFQRSKPQADKKADAEEPVPEKSEETETQEVVQGFSITINVGWANILLGRVVYGCVHDAKIIENIREFMQKKLSVLKVSGVWVVLVGHWFSNVSVFSCPVLWRR